MFVTFREERTNIKVGDTVTDRIGVGTIVIYSISPETRKIRQLVLYKARYSPNFYSNLISYGSMI